MIRFMSPVIVNDARTGKPIAVMKDDPEGRYVHWCDAYAQCSAPSASAPVEVTDEVIADLRTITQISPDFDGEDEDGERHELHQCLETAKRIARRALTAALKGKPSEQEPKRDDSRCARCGWTLRKKASDGCVRGNCSYRPEPPLARHQFYDAERWDREAAALGGKGEG